MGSLLLMKKKIIRDKHFKRIINHIEEKIGSNSTGAMIAILADALDNLTEGVESRNIRCIEIKFNDFYSTKFDFYKGEYVDAN